MYTKVVEIKNYLSTGMTMLWSGELEVNSLVRELCFASNCLF